jgi:ribosome-binding protein aMBF1 (putative translation factor)
MIDFDDVRKKWMQDPEFVKEYEALEEEFSLASAMIAARAHADMTQQDVAAKMETSQSYIAKLEGGAVSPTMKALKRYAEATGSRIKITFEPVSSQP